MDLWEYSIARIHRSQFEEEWLNHRGEVGWELIGPPSISTNGLYQLVFKRKKEKGTRVFTEAIVSRET
jgi:hypothetical protein